VLLDGNPGLLELAQQAMHAGIFSYMIFLLT